MSKREAEKRATNVKTRRKSEEGDDVTTGGRERETNSDRLVKFSRIIKT